MSNGCREEDPVIKESDQRDKSLEKVSFDSKTQAASK